jgi:hypothetical protein
MAGKRDMGDEAPHKDIAGQAGSGEPHEKGTAVPRIVSEDTRQKKFIVRSSLLKVQNETTEKPPTTGVGAKHV